MNTLEAIITHGLSVRQIPLTASSTYISSGSNDQFIETQSKKPHVVSVNAYEHPIINKKTGETVRINTCVTIVTKNVNGGFWMCKKVSSNSSSVTWHTTEDNLAETLEDSVKLFLSKNPI